MLPDNGREKSLDGGGYVCVSVCVYVSVSVSVWCVGVCLCVWYAGASTNQRKYKALSNLTYFSIQNAIMILLTYLYLPWNCPHTVPNELMDLISKHSVKLSSIPRVAPFMSPAKALSDFNPTTCYIFY